MLVIRPCIVVLRGGLAPGVVVAIGGLIGGAHVLVSPFHAQTEVDKGGLLRVLISSLGTLHGAYDKPRAPLSNLHRRGGGGLDIKSIGLLQVGRIHLRGPVIGVNVHVPDATVEVGAGERQEDAIAIGAGHTEALVTVNGLLLPRALGAQLLELSHGGQADVCKFFRLRVVDLRLGGNVIIGSGDVATDVPHRCRRTIGVLVSSPSIVVLRGGLAPGVVVAIGGLAGGAHVLRAPFHT